MSCRETQTWTILCRQIPWSAVETCHQKYSRLRCFLCVKGLVICFYLGWSGSILQFRQNIIKVGSKSWLLTCRSNITLSLPYTGSALNRELNFCNGYLSLLYFWTPNIPDFKGLIMRNLQCEIKKLSKNCNKGMRTYSIWFDF